MPDFKLRIWQTQTLYDCYDYVVTAPTLEEAALKLQAAYDQAVATDARSEHPDIKGTHRGAVFADSVCPLDPDEVLDCDVGITELNEDGSAGRRIHIISEDEAEVEPLKRVGIASAFATDAGDVAACEIEWLRMQRQTILAAFRANMMRLSPGYSHEAFDQLIATILPPAPEAT